MNNLKNGNWHLIIKIVIAILFFIICFFLLRNLVKLIKKPTDIFVVEEGVLSLDETVDAYIIRNETVLKGENYKNGMEKTVSEGKKVGSGETVFRYYSDGEGDIRARINELTNEIEKVQENETTIFNNDVETLKKQIKILMEESYELNNIEEIQKNKKQIDEYTNKISKIVGETSPAGSYLKGLIDERNSCFASLTSNAEEIIAPSSGTVSYRIDEFEDVLKSDNFDYLSQDFLKNLDLRTGELIPISEESGKIINEFNCYIAVITNSEAAMNSNVGDRVKIDIGSDGNVSATIKYIKEDGDKRIIVFEANSLDEKLINYRKISINVIWWEYTGLKIPNSAIIHEGDLDYVQRNRAGYNAKVLVKIVRSNDDYSLVENYTASELKELGFGAEEIKNMYNIKLYDKIKVDN